MDTTKHGLRRELKLWDLVPMQVALIVWLGWAGFAAKQGSTQIVLWLLAIFLFYLPLAAVVIKLSQALPVEGGVYQWVKEGLSPFAGYMAGWNLTLYSVTSFAVVGPIFANSFAYAAGSKGAWMLNNRPFSLEITAGACLIAFVFNVLGLQVAKWWSNVGSVLTVATFVALLGLLARGWIMGFASARSSFSLAWPSFSIVTLAVFAKMSIGALAGFDNSAVFSEECRKPENDVARSVLIAAPLIALMYILSTSAMLTYVDRSNVDMAAAVPQVMQAGFGSTNLGRALVAVTSIGFSISFMASWVIIIGMVARLPMVAGWDGLLPRWWSELHPRFRTPVKAVSAVTASALALGILASLRAGNQEAVQVGVSAGVGSLCIMYILLFAVVLFGFRSRAWRPGVGIRLGALCAFLVACISLIFEVVPLGEVASTTAFAVKVGGVILGTNALGAYLYWSGKRGAQLAGPVPAIETIRETAGEDGANGS
jgi:amino acid transporter